MRIKLQIYYLYNPRHYCTVSSKYTRTIFVCRLNLLRENTGCVLAERDGTSDLVKVIFIR